MKACKNIRIHYTKYNTTTKTVPNEKKINHEIFNNNKKQNKTKTP